MSRLQEMLAESLYWEIRKLGYNPDNDKILALLEKTYEMGYRDGSNE